MIRRILIFMLLTFDGVSTHWRPLCKDTFTIAWWSIPPYIYERNNSVSGILPVIMKKMIHDCCNAEVNLSYDLKLANKVEAVEQVSNGTADFVLPLIVKNGKRKFLSFPHITIVESPGIAFYSSKPLSAGRVLLEILLKAAPILLLITVMVMIAGTMYWLLEKRHVSSIIPGVLDGMWWAFVTMTTVGYGDISPTTKKGRLMAVLWVVIGIVACSLFVAVVSSVLTTTCLSQTSDLRGNEIAVIGGSQEHALAIRKSAKPILFLSVEEIANSLDQGTSSGALLDSYVAGFYQNLFKTFRLNDLKEDLFNYGVVLMPSVMKYEQCFKNYLISRQDDLFRIVSENIIPLRKTSNQSTAEEMSLKILHFDDIPVHYSIPLLFVFVMLVFSLCIFKDKIKCQRKRHCQTKTAKYDLYSQEEALRILHENHQRDMLNCLYRMRNESELLQDLCSTLSTKAESEIKYMINDKGMPVETCL